MQNVKFGTDGIRDVVNNGLDATIAYKTGCALALHLTEKEDNPTVIIGMDTRLSGYMLASAFASGLMTYGANVCMAGFLSTPALAFTTRTLHYSAGVMITASHNPSNYNGIKVFSSDGVKYNSKECKILERFAELLPKYQPKDADNVGILKESSSHLSKYLNFLKKKAPKCDILKICIDCANGVTNFIAPKVFNTVTKDLKVVGSSTTSSLVNLNCGATCPENLSKWVIDGGYDVGFAFDGDGDRLIAVDEKGNIVDGDDILVILANYYKKRHRLNNLTVVGTVMTNYGTEASLKRNGINLIRQPVGDRFIQSLMLEKDYSLGGEHSGHIICSKTHCTGDGVFTALELLRVMKFTGLTLSQLASESKKYPSTLISVPVKNENKEIILTHSDLKELIRECEHELAYSGRILIRASGTESSIRVLVEGENVALNNKLAHILEQKIIELN